MTDLKYAPEGTLAYRIPLVPGSSRCAYLELPEDLTTDECARLGRFVEAIALPIESIAEWCENSRAQCAYLCTCEATDD